MTQDLGISIVLEYRDAIFVTIIIPVTRKDYTHISQIVCFDLGNDANEANH